MGWSVYSGDNSKAGNLIDHIESDDVEEKKVHIPPEIPIPLTKVVENSIPDFEANSRMDYHKPVENSNSGGIPTPRHQSDTHIIDHEDADGIPTPRQTPILDLLIVESL